MANNVDNDLISQREEIFKNSPIGILFFNSKGELIDANPATLKIIGFTDFESIKWLKIFDNEDIKLRNQELNEKKIIRFKAPLPSNFKSKRQEVIIDWIITESNSGYLVQMKDITEEEYTEKELKRSLRSEEKIYDKSERLVEELRDAKEEYRVMAETVPYGVWKTDPEGELTYASPAFLELIKMELSDLKGSEWMRNLSPEDIEPAIKKWTEHIKQGEDDEMWDTTYDIIGPDKKYHAVLARGLPVHDKNGKIISWVGINLDFTEYKKTKDSLKKALENAKGDTKDVLLRLADTNKSLELEVLRRLKVEEELRDSLKALKLANNEISQLTYITSHDLQEPLITMSNYAGLLKRRYGGQLDNDADEFIDYMMSGATRMQDMIKSLRDYSSISAKKTHFKRFDAEEAFKDALANLKSSIKDNNAEVTNDKLPVIYADKSQIVMVFGSLIDNALKFRREGVTPKIHISARKEDDEYIFSVSDNGIGMEIQYADKIFDIFKRLHSIGEFEGSGIGLAIVKRIIERHGGRIWVESEFGVGSTFYFIIPIINKI